MRRMGGTSRRILCVIAPERFRDEELAEPKRALEAAGHRVTVASTRPGHATGMLGARVAVDAVGAQMRAAGSASAVCAGGAGAPTLLWDHEPLIALVRELHALGWLLAAICLAPPVLARAGV